MFTRIARSAAKVNARAFSTAAFKDSDVVIVSAARTPIGSFQGSLSSFSGAQLGSIAIAEAVKRAGIDVNDVGEVILGNVVGANAGQAPATQASMKAGIPVSVPSWGINKVCASGLKTVMLAAQSIQTGHNHVIVTGGMESMSNIPFYLPKARSGFGLGHGEVVDGLIKDGLWDAADNHHMGMCGEAAAAEYNITRADQDAYAIESYRRAQVAQKAGAFKSEIVNVIVKDKKGDITIADDEEPAKLKADKIPGLRPAFKPNGGTVTAANASKLNDGAASLIVTSGKYAREKGLKPLAKIRGFADAQRRPLEFTTAPALAIPKSLTHAGLSLKDVDLYEINEAFSVVALANIKLLDLDVAKLNVFGGAVALGHPIGASGARILVTLLNALKQKDRTIGVAAICNGGGGASSLVVERLN